MNFAKRVAAGVIKHHGLPESVAMVADALGFRAGPDYGDDSSR